MYVCIIVNNLLRNYDYLLIIGAPEQTRNAPLYVHIYYMSDVWSPIRHYQIFAIFKL